ncbi:hypothetical protein [Acinetobacter oleivorans]|uniref:hypothetical protein n=1 Tax=uncultured Acinetobacter sp. TaxID=165433 RepID=UPI0025E06FDD|nr:hypothetical protein [Acinetobacter oleivorans]
MNVLLGLVIVILVGLIHQKVEQEKTAAAWRNQMQIAKEDYEKKIKALELPNVTLTTERMPVVLSETKRKYANVSEVARAEYTDTLNIVFEQCVGEYRRMAQIADKHAIDAERLIKTLPIIKEPP